MKLHLNIQKISYFVALEVRFAPSHEHYHYFSFVQHRKKHNLIEFEQMKKSTSMKLTTLFVPIVEKKMFSIKIVFIFI